MEMGGEWGGGGAGKSLWSGSFLISLGMTEETATPASIPLPER